MVCEGLLPPPGFGFPGPCPVPAQEHPAGWCWAPVYSPSFSGGHIPLLQEHIQFFWLENLKHAPSLFLSSREIQEVPTQRTASSFAAISAKLQRAPPAAPGSAKPLWPHDQPLASTRLTPLLCCILAGATPLTPLPGALLSWPLSAPFTHPLLKRY